MKARNKICSKDSTNLRFVQDFHNFCASSLKLSLWVVANDMDEGIMEGEEQNTDFSGRSLRSLSGTYGAKTLAAASWNWCKTQEMPAQQPSPFSKQPQQSCALLSAQRSTAWSYNQKYKNKIFEVLTKLSSINNNN